MQHCCITMSFLSTFSIRKPNSLLVPAMLDLEKISDPEVNFVHWQRLPDEDIHQFGNALLTSAFTGFSLTATAQTVREQLQQEFDKSAIHTVGKLLLLDDMVALTCRFLSITGQAQTRLYLKAVSDDACRKFHTDRYDLRLLCTYVGAGTEWIDDRYVNRHRLMGGDNESIIKDFSKVKCMQPFEVGILRGEASPDKVGKGIVHRSPPIQHKNEKRLVFRLDN